MNALRAHLRDSLLVMDGAMGTQIQQTALSATAWHGREGCNEWLSLSAPEVVHAIHRAYFAAGADAVETNTFGASPLTLGEYGLADRAAEINRAAAELARQAADACAAPGRPRFVFGSIGPGTKLPSLGQVTFDELCAGYRVQVEGLLAGGADAFIVETVQDPLQAKAALAAIADVLGDPNDRVVYVSVTVETTGTLLVGSTIAAATAILAPYPIDILGLNCATGPAAMRIHLDYLRANWGGAVGCMPNAGLPRMDGTRVTYPLGAEDFATQMSSLAREVPLRVVGGCCGTTPAHVRRLRARLEGFVPPAESGRPAAPQVASLFGAVDLDQSPAPLFVGERANATGSKKFREALLADDYEACFHTLVEQEEAGSHVADLSCAYAGRDERHDLTTLVARAARECRMPLMVDSTQVDVVEAALACYGGRALVNSINFEDGEGRADRVARLARRHGAALVGLTIDEEGMAMTADRKVAIARRLVGFCAARGHRPGDLLIDPLTFTIGSGDESLRTAALETLEALRRIKAELPGVRTLLGLSNVSFGLKPAARKVLNAVFLDRALRAGLDACIVNVAQIVPLADLPDAERRAAEALLDNDGAEGDPLARYIRAFEDAAETEAPSAAGVGRPAAEVLAECVVKGRPAALETAIADLLRQRRAEDILNGILIPAMKEVGRLFNDGLLQLPFVLKSAEVMKRAVDLIRPHLAHADAAHTGTMVIATVAGDVHDIGKNLVDIILSNNGFRVVNLGTKVPVERMMAAAREHRADVLGMSGLLVKSALVMAENLRALAASELRLPVFLGGAALTPEFVAGTCVPLYAGPVVYCRDAFAGLARMRELVETGGVRPEAAADGPPPVELPDTGERASVDRGVPVPVPPFLGARVAEGPDLEEVYTLLNETALVRGRWGYRRGRLPAAEYAELVAREVEPRLRDLKRRCREERLFEPRAAYGWFRCRSDGDVLTVWPADEGAPHRLEFPRQPRAPGFAIPDFFRRDGDVVGFMVVTLGPRIDEESRRLMGADRYQDYVLLHGFAVEVADALAEYWHARMRAELGFADGPMAPQDYVTQRYRGSRYGFGYPSCPDLAMNRVCCGLVGAERIGVTLSENDMMVPEMSTSALVAHHPQAKYFYV